MKTRSFLLITTTLMMVAVVITSCRRNRDSTLSSSNNALAESMFDDVYKQIDDAASQQDSLTQKTATYTLATAQCATVTLEPVTQGQQWPKRLTIDFGTTNCVGQDGRVRTGKIICEFTGFYREEGTVITTTLDNYHVNGNLVEGTHSVTNEGRNANNHIYFTISVVGARVTTPDGQIDWTSTRTRTWVEGEETTWWTDGLNGILDDVYEIDGTASGTNIEGGAFTAEITEPLRIQIGCRWVTKGKLDLTPQNLATRTVDYGDGTCDNAASVEVNGNTYHFTMY